MAQEGDSHLIETRKPRFFYGYIIVLVASIVLIVVGGTIYAFGVYFEPLLTEFGWTRATTSGAYSLIVFMQGLLALVMGGLSDRFGPRPLTVVCAIFVASGYFLLSRLSDIWQLYLAYGLLLALGFAIWVPMFSTVARWFVKRRGLMTGITVSLADITLLIWPLLTAWFISIYDWRTSYIITGIITFVVLMVATRFLRRDPGQMGLSPYGESEVAAENLSLQGKGVSFRRAVRTRQLWILCSVYGFLCFTLYAVPAHIVIHATGLGISVANAANVAAVIGAGAVIGGIIMGFATDRIGSKKALIITCILLLVSLSWLLVTKELWMFYLFAIIFGVGFGCLWVLQSPVVAELFGLRSHGAIFGVSYFIGSIGGTIGPVITGHIFDITNSYQLAFFIYVAVSVVGFILVLLLKPISRQEEFSYHG